MTIKAQRVSSGQMIDWTADASYSSGDVIQLKDGRAAVVSVDVTSGDTIGVYISGRFKVLKTTSMVFLTGGRAYWDQSASKSHFKKVNDRDFYLGRYASDAASADTVAYVNLNIDPPYDIDMARDPALTTLVGTPAALAVSLNYPRRLGGSWLFYLSATSEAQKVDLIARDGFNTNANAIHEFAFVVPNGGSGSASDFSIGLANATHASDADTIADSIFVHLDGGSQNVYLESDDGTTEVAATDSTIDWTAGTTNATRIECWMDMRDPTDVQIYLDGVLMLASTVFGVNAYAGPWYPIVHIEKTTGTETADFILEWMRTRLGQV